MKRAFVLFLIASMLSTHTVYAAGDLEAFSDVSGYAEEYAQDGSEDYSSQEEYADCGEEYYETSGEPDSEAESVDAGDAYSDYESAGYSETAQDGEECASESACPDTVTGEGEEDASEESEAVSESESLMSEGVPESVDSGTEGVSDSKDSEAESLTDSGAFQPEGEADSEESETEDVPVSESPRTENVSDAGEFNAGSGSKYDGGYESSVAETEGSAEDAAGAAISKKISRAVPEDKAAPPLKKSGSEDGDSVRTRIAIMSDIHYVTDQLISDIGRENLVNAALTETRLMEEIDAILTAALEGVSKTEPNALLICGDLVSNGELLGAKTLAAKLKAAKEKNGFENTGFYVVNGNHDINNSYAADFTGPSAANAERVQPSDFAEVFSGLGYGENDHWAGGSHSIYVPSSDDPSRTMNHGGLSYAADIADGITLIVLDTGIYSIDDSEQSMYNNAQKTAGYVSDDLLAWAAEQAKEAKAKGNLVLAMSHHGLLPHYDTDLEDKAAWYMNSFRVPNWENVAETLADAGVTAVLTGHTHANDIAKYVSKNNNVLYDVETAALCAYPCVWRAFDIVTNGEGEEKTYTISIDTTYINDDLQADTSSWSFTIGDKTKTFDGDYNGNLQEYSYEKSGIHEGMLDLTAMYMIKNTLSDIVNHKDGLAGYIKEQLEVPEDQSLGEYAVEYLRNAINGFTDFTQTISGMMFKGELTLENATKEGDENPSFNIKAELNGVAEQGKVTLDMSYIPKAVDELTEKTQTKLLEGEWMRNPYSSNPLLDDIRKLIRNGVVPALSQPLEENDPDSTAVKLFNDAWQSFGKGDEGLADDEQKAKWEHERELLGGEVLADKLTQGLWNEVLKLNTPAYPTLSELLSQRIAGEEQRGILTITTEKPSDYLLPALANLFSLNDLNTMSALIRTASSLSIAGLENPIPSSVVKPLTDKVVDLHEVMTTDHNITHDNKWEFWMVHFDANGGTVSQTHALTVEDHKLVSLPTPDERENYTFDGWFTSETGGRQVTADEDMTGINTLYAHWTYTGRDEEPDDKDDDEKDDGKEDEKEDGEKEPQVPDKQDEDDSKVEPAKDKEEEVSPAIPAAPADRRSSGGRKDRETRNRAARDLHDYFVSRKALHDKIDHVEYSDIEHEKYCAAIVSALKKGETIFNMGPWLSLNADAAAAIENSDVDITLEYVGVGIGFRVVIPAGSKISRFADENGSVCIVCLAENYGYERIGADEVLRRPLA